MADGVSDIKRIKEILAEVKRLAVEYYQLTKKPLGVTGEVAEYVAAECLNLRLVGPRTAGYDAIRDTPTGPEHIQIKGRVVRGDSTLGQRIGRIKADAKCDKIILVLLDSVSLEPSEMWEASFKDIVARLQEPGSKARNERGALSIHDFKRRACQIWPKAACRKPEPNH